MFFFFFQAEDGIRDIGVTGVQTCALPICVITKFNAQEFIDQTYFDRAKDLGASAISLTFVEDRSDVEYSLLPDQRTMVEVSKSVLDYMKKSNSLKMLIPPEYFHQIIEYGRTVFDECGVWKSIFVNANGT